MDYMLLHQGRMIKAVLKQSTLMEGTKLSEIEEHIEQETDDDDNENDKIQRFDELIGTAFNDLVSSDSDSNDDDNVTDHNIPDLPNEKSITNPVAENEISAVSMIEHFQNGFLQTQLDNFKQKCFELEQIRLNNETKLQHLENLIVEKNLQIELLEGENNILKNQQSNSKDLFKRINELENDKIDYIKKFEAKRSSLENDLMKWKTVCSDLKNENEQNQNILKKLNNENNELKCEINEIKQQNHNRKSEEVQTSFVNDQIVKKSVNTSTTCLNESKVLKEIQQNHLNTIDKQRINISTSTLPWNSLLSHITEEISDQCEQAIDEKYSQLIQDLQSKLIQCKKEVTRMEDEMAVFLNRYQSFLVKIDTIFS